VIGHEKSANFIFGEVCSYEVKWPEQATDGDQLSVKAVEIAAGATVYAAYGSGFA